MVTELPDFYARPFAVSSRLEDTSLLLLNTSELFIQQSGTISKYFPYTSSFSRNSEFYLIEPSSLKSPWPEALTSETYEGGGVARLKTKYFRCEKFFYIV